MAVKKFLNENEDTFLILFPQLKIFYDNLRTTKFSSPDYIKFTSYLHYKNE